MAEATITLPDGSSAKITGPDRETITRKAQQLKQAFQNRGQGIPEVIGPQQTQEQAPEQEPLGPLGLASGVGQTALTIGTGAVAEPVSGIWGLLRGTAGGILGEEDIMSNMAETIESARDLITVEPFTESGERVIGAISPIFEYYFGKAQEKGVEDLERTGSPLVGTITQTGMELIPSALGLRGTRSVTRGQIRGAERFAREEGINIRRRGEPLREEVAEAARGRADPVRGRSMEAMQNVVNRAREEAKANVDRQWDLFRSKRAGVPVEQAMEFPDLARRSIRDFSPLDDMPKVQKRLAELDQIRELPRDSAVTLRSIDDWNRKLNRDRPPKSDKAQNAVLNILRAQADNWLETKFNTDMISGDPSAFQAWRNAKDATRRYKQQFDEDKVIAQFARQDATPQEIRQWVFGASSVGASKQASRTIQKLKKLAGEESPEFVAMRSDAMFDVMEPLFRDEPSLKGFVSKYDQMVTRNPEMARELFGDSLPEYKRLRDFAAAARRRGDPPDFGSLFPRVVAVLSLGHGIAKQALKVTGMQRVINAIRESNNKEMFLRELFDDPIDNPMLGRVMRTGAVTQSAADAGERESRQPMGAQ